MSVTLEISISDLIKNNAKNPRDLKFIKPFEAAQAIYKKNGGDFLSLFIAQNKIINKGLKLNYLLKGAQLGIRSTDSEVEAYFRTQIASSMDGVEIIMNRRINQFGVAQPNIQKILLKIVCILNYLVYKMNILSQKSYNQLQI